VRGVEAEKVFDPRLFLTEHRDVLIKASEQEIAARFNGNWREEHLLH
jgi:hypothetical protein